MAAPTLTASLNKGAYAVGETMTLTVTYGDTDQKAGTVSVVVTDAEGNASDPVVSPYLIDPLNLTVTDPTRTWVKVSDSGSVAVYTSTA